MRFRNLGGFGIFRDYRGIIRVFWWPAGLFAGTEWVTPTKVDYDEALGAAESAPDPASDVILLLAIALACGPIVAAWRHGASSRAAEIRSNLA